MIIDMIRQFKQKIQKEAVYGPFCKTGDPAFIEIAGLAGFDFVIIDLEHGPNSVESVQNLIRAACISNTLPVVRVKENNFPIIGEVLDIGAGGIQVPQITCHESAEKVDGIDVIFIGPYDLSQSLGVPGQIDNPLVAKKMVEIVDICSKNGINVGTFVDTPENAEKWKNTGVRYLSYNVDVGIFYEACSCIVKHIRNQ